MTDDQSRAVAKDFDEQKIDTTTSMDVNAAARKAQNIASANDQAQSNAPDIRRAKFATRCEAYADSQIKWS